MELINALLNGLYLLNGFVDLFISMMYACEWAELLFILWIYFMDDTYA